jgi:hypothetical protein
MNSFKLSFKQASLRTLLLFISLGIVLPYSNSASAADPQSPPVLNTFILDSVQIDQKIPVSLSPEDANLLSGADSADGTPSFNFPEGGPGSYIDWNELGADMANHRLLDLNSSSGKDSSSFPLSNECIGPSQVLSKMDLTYIASANNNQFAYFAVQRSNNSGDAGYYWLFTKLQPKQILGQAPCKTTQSRLLYDISGPSGGSTGDVLLSGHFHPNGTPLLRVFHAKTNISNVSAVNAIDFTDTTLWTEDPAGVAAVAINTTPTAPGSFGAAGVLAVANGNLDAEIFAETAVPLSVFTGNSTCGSTFYGSVITRSSGSGGTSPDLKDLAGPALFNFGGITAQAKLTPTCGLKAGFEASAAGFNGQAVQNPQCMWTFDNGSTSSSCTGFQNLPSGLHSATVKLTDPASGCSDTVAAASINVFPPLAVSATLIGGCQSSFTYDASVTGGSNSSSLGYNWSFSGGSSVSPTASVTKAGKVIVGQGGISYTGNVTVTETRSAGLVCTANASSEVKPYSPLAVQLLVVTPPAACPMITSDAVAYIANPSGGTGHYSYIWTDPICNGITCTIDPADSSFCFNGALSVTVADSDGICASVTSAPATYTKTTTVSGTAGVLQF